MIFLKDRQVMSVSVTTSPSFSAGTPAPLFETTERLGPFVFDVTADAQQFLVPERTTEGRAAQQIHVVLNWFDELKRLAPADN